MKPILAIVAIAAACVVNPGITTASPYLVLAADTADRLNAQELRRIQSGEAPMPPPATSEAQSACPPGAKWLPAGYGKHGKWRPAGCYRR
jgi:hypothetical protein